MVKLLKKVLVVVLAGGKGDRLDPLTRDRTKPAVPFGGIYRIIDFSLSNAINSNLRKTIVLVQYKCISLNRHIREGWSFLCSALGEYIETISPQQRVSDHWYLGTADAVYQNLYSVEKESPENVLILAGDHVYKMDYNHILRFHRDSDADITVSAIEVPVKTANLYGIMQVDENSNIVGFAEKPKEDEVKTTLSHPDTCLASMGIYVFKSEALYRILQEDKDDHKSSHDFGRDIIPKSIDKYKTLAFNFIDENKKEAKYWRDVGTIDAYYQANMDLVSVTPLLNLYDKEWLIHTAAPQMPPPKFVFAGGENDNRLGMALDSMVSPGCVISGGQVRNSILSPNVRVNSFSQVLNSIIFENVNIGRYAKIRNAIIDKDVKIPEGIEIGYNLEEDKKRFTVSPNDIIIISKGAIL
ncbi:MAG: glucose-1-phosphate adenylyltransferase [Planctomycetota bacterium]|nr:glucose-1-phosphate adenylyltransferase [Planctomycetota bacterium]